LPYPRTSRVTGFFLVAVSLASIVQSIREENYQDAERGRYVEHDLPERRWQFGGHTFDVRDDRQTADRAQGDVRSDGTLQLFVDGRPLGPPSRAVVREEVTGAGRYFPWFEAVVFEERASGRTSLWIARALGDGPVGPAFQVVVVDEGGAIQVREVKRSDPPVDDYRLSRVLQFMGGPPPPLFPMSVLGAAFFWPMLLVYPLGTLLLGLYLAFARRRTAPAVASP
jgi:hypothetical protein